MAGRGWKSSGLKEAGTGSIKATPGLVKSVILVGTTTAGYVTLDDNGTILIELRIEAGTANSYASWNGGPVAFSTDINYTVNGTNCKAIVFYQ